MTELKNKTDANLWRRLSESAKRDFTDGEADEQRVSFIFAGLPENTGMTKAEIKKSLRVA